MHRIARKLKPAKAKRRAPHIGTPWQLQEAKAKFSEVFDKAYDDGPQIVTRRNKQAVVILAERDYENLKRSWKTPSLVEALLTMPRVRGFKIPDRDKNDRVPSERSVFD